MDTRGEQRRPFGLGLYEFLIEAELQQYYMNFKGDLKVQNTAQLKYITDEDLKAIGMSKPEMRRLKKYYQKHFPKNYLSKFKKILLSGRDDKSSGSVDFLLDESQDKSMMKIPNKHIISTESIVVNKELGTGEFGVVQQGVWNNDGERIQVAIKCLSRERMQNNPIEFLKEAAIMHSIDHDHIVRLYGVVLDTNSFMLVTELAPLRSLLECLKQPSLRANFTVISLCDFAIQIADGMQYLEMKRLIHRDLAARNILVYSKNKVKISDFGLSRALGVGKDYYRTNFNVNLKLPIAWCAPESITYLKFTSSSDVWAYGVTLWEMFSYGFQPWPALTGHQILEAIDEPNFQRLEQPDCCPKDYYGLMQRCWQHEPEKRPKFCELVNLLPDLRPEQVQALQDSNDIGHLPYHQGDIITVIDKEIKTGLWKGVLNNGKTGIFNPAHTIAYLGSNLPSTMSRDALRGSSRNMFGSHRRKIRTDMISSPQDDFRHTGHVGSDGAYFGDLSFLGTKYSHLPRLVVTPYKPHEDAAEHSRSFADQNLISVDAIDHFASDNASMPNHNISKSGQSSMLSEHIDARTLAEFNERLLFSPNLVIDNNTNSQHEYHEISDEERHENGMKFDKSIDVDLGPSLLDEMDQMFQLFGKSSFIPAEHCSSVEHESSNVRNEIREMQSKQGSKKKQATVKPISAADQKTLYSAIAMAQELTARSMTDLECPVDSLQSSASPSRRRKFSIKLSHQTSPKHNRRHYSEEAASIPDIQSTVSDEAKEVYNSLVEGPVLDNATDTNPLKILRCGLPVKPQIRGNKNMNTGLFVPQIDEIINLNNLKKPFNTTSRVENFGHTSLSFYNSQALKKYNSMLSIQNQGNQNNAEENPIPLPPRDRSKTLQPQSGLPRHRRKHPLIIPGSGISRTLAMASDTAMAEDQSDSNALLNEGTENDVCSTQKVDTIIYPSRDETDSYVAFQHQPDVNLINGSSSENTTNIDCNSTKTDNLFKYSDPLSEYNLADKKTEYPHHNGAEATDEICHLPTNFSQPNSLPADEFFYKTVNDTSFNFAPLDKVSLDSTKLSTKTSTCIDKSTKDAIKTSEDISKLNLNNNSSTGCSTSNSSANNSGGSNNKINKPAYKTELFRQSDHVSCEDLLEFACDRPNVHRTRGPLNGPQSDEVRIMLKVLHDQSTPESCITALNATNWEILTAIKLERLRGLLQKDSDAETLKNCQRILNQYDGDVVKAAAFLKSEHDNVVDHKNE